MGTHRGPGLCAAADVCYLGSEGARAAAVLAGDASFTGVLAEYTAVTPEVAPYQPGEFYLRELPPLRAVLDGIPGLGLLVVDGYADLDPDGRPGLGAHAHTEFGIPVIGVAKSAFRTATHAIAVRRGTSARPVFVTAAGMSRIHAARTWLAGSGYPTPCAAPTPSPAPDHQGSPRSATTPAEQHAHRGRAEVHAQR